MGPKVAIGTLFWTTTASSRERIPSNARFLGGPTCATSIPYGTAPNTGVFSPKGRGYFLKGADRGGASCGARLVEGGTTDIEEWQNRPVEMQRHCPGCTTWARLTEAVALLVFCAAIVVFGVRLWRGELDLRLTLATLGSVLGTCGGFLISTGALDTIFCAIGVWGGSETVSSIRVVAIQRPRPMAVSQARIRPGSSMAVGAVMLRLVFSSAASMTRSRRYAKTNRLKCAGTRPSRRPGLFVCPTS